MALAKNHSVQLSILSFFKKNNGDLQSKGGTQVKTTNKRPIEHVDNEPTEVEDFVIDVNCIDLNLKTDLFEESQDNYLTLTENESSKIDDFNSNFVLSVFRQILKAILSDHHYSMLFDEIDWNVIEKFTSLPGPIQLLYFKLYMRKRSWIRLSNIKYPEVDSNCNHINSIKFLLSNGFLDDSSKLDSIEDGLNALNLVEFKNFLKKYNGFKMSTNKSRTIELFLKYIKTTRSVMTLCDSSKTILDAVLKRLQEFLSNKCFKINKENSMVIDRIFLLYYSPNDLISRLDKQNDFQWHKSVFGDYSNRSQIFPVSQTNKEKIIYSSREEFLEYQLAFELVNKIISELNIKNYVSIVHNYLDQALSSFQRCFQKWSVKDMKLNPFLRTLCATELYIKAVHECLSALDKLKKYEQYIQIVKDTLLVQTCYGIKYRPHWYTRAALICHSHLKNPDLAKEFCVKGLDDQFVKSFHNLELYTRLTKIDKKHEFVDLFSNIFSQVLYNQSTIFAEYKHIQNDTERKNFFLHTYKNGDQELLSVEDVVIHHYTQKDFTDGIHCESSLYHMFLALLFWDIIYTLDIKDSFRYRNQLAPLDLNFDCFSEQRYTSIEVRLQQISSFSEEKLIDFLTTSWLENLDKASFLINWESISLEKLIEIAKCFTAEKIAMICKLLICDFRHFRRGLPDLVMWNSNTYKLKIVEVKGPSDKLSFVQTIWLNNLASMGLDVEVCNVKPKSFQTC